VARFFDDFVVDHAAGAGGFAGTAGEAGIEMLANGAGGIDVPIGQSTHDLDSPARAFGFEAGLNVGRA